MSDPEEWGTVAEAARRLNLHARQVRRYAARLGTEDRTPEGQSPLKVRMSAVMSLVQSSRLEKEPEDRGQDRDRTPEGTGTAEKDSVPPVSLPSDLRLIEHLEAEVTFLRSSLEAASVERSELRRLLLVEQDAVKRLTSGPQAAAVDPDMAPQSASDAETMPPASQEPLRDVPATSGAYAAPPASPKGLEKKSWWTRFVDALLLRD